MTRYWFSGERAAKVVEQPGIESGAFSLRRLTIGSLCAVWGARKDLTACPAACVLRGARKDLTAWRVPGSLCAAWGARRENVSLASIKNHEE